MKHFSAPWPFPLPPAQVEEAVSSPEPAVYWCNTQCYLWLTVDERRRYEAAKELGFMLATYGAAEDRAYHLWCRATAQPCLRGIIFAKRRVVVEVDSRPWAISPQSAAAIRAVLGPRAIALAGTVYLPRIQLCEALPLLRALAALWRG